MPSPFARFMIVIFWSVMTTWLVYRDVLPRLGYGELNYQAILSDRAIDDTTHWNLFLDGHRIGNSWAIVKPETKGGYLLSSRVDLNRKVFEILGAPEFGPVLLYSEFRIRRSGELREFKMSLTIESTNWDVLLNGTVDDRTLTITAEGIPGFNEPKTVPIDPKLLLLNGLGPMDRLPGLRIGKKWKTKTVDPISSILMPGNVFGGGPRMQEVFNEVTGTEERFWKDRNFLCYRIDHEAGGLRYPTWEAGGLRYQTWVRVSDDRVLEQEIPLLGRRLQMVLEPERIQKGQ